MTKLWVVSVVHLVTCISTLAGSSTARGVGRGGRYEETAGFDCGSRAWSSPAASPESAHAPRCRSPEPNRLAPQEGGEGRENQNQGRAWHTTHCGKIQSVFLKGAGKVFTSRGDQCGRAQKHYSFYLQVPHVEFNFRCCQYERMNEWFHSSLLYVCKLWVNNSKYEANCSNASNAVTCTTLFLKHGRGNFNNA